MVVSRTYSGVYLLIGLHAVLVYVLPQIVTEEWAFLRRIWGFHFWEFYPVWAVVCAYSVAVLMAIPGIQRRAYDVLSVWIPKGMFSYKHLFFFCLSVASWGVFWIFRQKYGFLGDGYLRAADLDRQQVPTEEMGILYLLIWLDRVLDLWGGNEVFTMQVFSTFWGGPYVFLTCLWADRMGGNVWEKGCVAGCLLFVGAIQYFFGYIEVYAPMPVFLLGFVWTGWQTLENRASLWWPTLLFGLGVLMHLMMAACLPALLCLWYFRHPSSGLPLPYLVVAAVAAGLGAPYVLGIIGNLHVLWLPLFENPDQPYAVFSFVHLWEWMNAQILGSPVAWPLLVFCGLVMRQSRRWADPYSVFLLLSAGGLVYGSLTLDFVLGSRDWDLQCFGSIALILLATDGIVRLLRSDLSSSLRHYVLGCAVVFSALNTIPWVHVNHTDRSVDRLSRMLSDDPATYYRKHPSDLMLGVLYNQAGLTRQALAAFERGMKRYPLDARLAYNAAALYLDLDQVDRAIVCGSRAVELEPGYVKVHALLALAYHTIRRLEKSLYHAERYLSLGGKDRVLQNLARDILKQEGLSGSASSSDR